MNEKSIQTVCILEHEGRILLGMKKVRLGAGLWNGFGGKVQPGETIEAAALREMKEESGLDVHDLEKFGVLEFKSPKRPLIEGHLFRTDSFTGTPTESDEMRPQWFTRAEIPFTQMWSSDLYWWPLYFHNKKFRGSFTFDENDRVVAHELAVVDTLEA
ncbi:MAG TPA: 8-oxo-dGTP diphosphatase [Candidatus Paceibacterota bacterium]|nr:8-oxo-dGTP diphosphatase [Candidatus Paceibacterota bacterium]